MIVVAGAGGLLGRLVVEELLKTVAAGEIVAAVRTPAKVKDLAERGLQVREADYARPETLAAAFGGGTKLLLISGSELGRREEQHKAVIDAAKTAGVEFVAYTSILHCDTSPLTLAREHVVTERDLRESGLRYAMLRNGWYFENRTAAIPAALAHGVLFGCAGNGRLAAAARADYAAAAATVLTGEGYENTVLELAGDEPHTLAELAAEVSEQTGTAVRYEDLPEAEYERLLSGFLPHNLAGFLADADAKTAEGALDDRSGTLSRLLRRPTMSLREAVAAALGKERHGRDGRASD